MSQHSQGLFWGNGTPAGYCSSSCLRPVRSPPGRDQLPNFLYQRPRWHPCGVGTVRPLSISHGTCLKKLTSSSPEGAQVGARPLHQVSAVLAGCYARGVPRSVVVVGPVASGAPGAGVCCVQTACESGSSPSRSEDVSALWGKGVHPSTSHLKEATRLLCCS